MPVQVIFLVLLLIGLILLFIWLGRQDPPDGSGPYRQSDGTFLGGGPV